MRKLFDWLYSLGEGIALLLCLMLIDAMGDQEFPDWDFTRYGH